MSGSHEWAVGTHVADAAALHALDLPAGRGVWSMQPVRPAFVLGSSQANNDVDEIFCAANGVDVARRRSGGGAVFVHPTDSLWIDVTIPRGDDLWVDDVGRAMHVVGRAWRAMLESHGVRDLEVNEGPHVATELSRQLCFAGRGSGEVFARHRKAVGISQRRTRDQARFQCIAYVVWDVAVHVGAIRAVRGRPDAAADLVGMIPRLEATEAVEGLAAALSRESV